MTEPERRRLTDEAIAQAYRDAAIEQPSAAVDDRIRAASHHALGALGALGAPQVAEARPVRPRRWQAPLALAATLALALGAAIKIYDSGEAGPATPDAAGTPKEADGTTQSSSQPAPADSGPGPAPAPAPARRPAPKPAENALAPRAAQSPAAPTPPSAKPAPHERQEPERRSDETKAEQLRSSETGRAAQADSSISPESSIGETRSPEQWIEDIRRLKSENRIEEAARQLEAFQRRYPNHLLPKDLQP